MKIKIRVHSNSSKEEIKTARTPAGPMEIWLREKPIDNKANIKIIKLLKEYFGKPVKITSGFTSRNKIIEV